MALGKKATKKSKKTRRWMKAEIASSISALNAKVRKKTTCTTRLRTIDDQQFGHRQTASPSKSKSE